MRAASLIRRVCEKFEAAGLRFLIIGGQAVIRHGHIRTTEDVNFTILAPVFDHDNEVVAILADLGFMSIDEDSDSLKRISSLYKCIDQETGFGLDVSFANTPYHEYALGRALIVDTDGYPTPYLGLEDLIIHKVLAGRPQDRIDAAELMARYPQFDSADVLSWLTEFEQLIDKPLIESFHAWRAEALA